MLNSVLSNLKQVNPLDLVESLAKKSQDSLKSTEALVEMARKALTQAMQFSEDEIRALSGKLGVAKLGEKTGAEFDKLIYGLVEKLVKGSEGAVDDSVKAEIAAMIVEFNTKDKALSSLKYFNELLAATAPKSIEELKNLKSTVATKLVADAQTRIEVRAQNTAEESQNSASAEVEA